MNALLLGVRSLDIESSPEAVTDVFAHCTLKADIFLSWVRDLHSRSSLSDSLSASGCAPIFLAGDAVELKVEARGSSFAVCVGNVADFFSSRSPHSLKSCSLSAASRSRSCWRLVNVKDVQSAWIETNFVASSSSPSNPCAA